MSELEKKWQESPARLLSYADHLPTHTQKTPKQDIFTTEKQRQDAVLEIVEFSGEELGRITEERRLYLEMAGLRYGDVRFLAGARELFLLQERLQAADFTIDEQTPEVKEAIINDIEGLRQLGDKLFAAPDQNRFNAIMARTHKKAGLVLADPNTSKEMKAVAHRALEQLPSGDPRLIDQYICEVPGQLADQWFPAVEEMYGAFIKLVEPGRTYSSNELAQLFDEVIFIMNTDWNLQNARRWKAQLYDGNNVNVYPSTESIRVPEGKAFSSVLAINVLVHEAGIHLLRRLNGENTGDPLLADGMPNSLDDEEALADTIGQIAAQDLEEDTLVYDAAIGLATFEPQVPLVDLKDRILDIEILRAGRSLTSKEVLGLQRQTHRVTRGMPSFVIDGKLRQLPYNADLKYTHNLPRAITFLMQHRENPLQALRWVMGGKFGYSDPKEVAHYQARSSKFTLP